MYCLLFMIHEQEYVLFNYLSMLHRTVLVFLIHGETFFFFFPLLSLYTLLLFSLKTQESKGPFEGGEPFVTNKIILC